MRLDTPRARLDLQRNELATLRHACRTRLDCLDGTAWITVQGDTRDIVLTRGESFRVDSPADVIVTALLSATVVDVLPPRRPVACGPEAAPRAAARRLRAAWLERVASAAAWVRRLAQIARPALPHAADAVRGGAAGLHPDYTSGSAR